jgi:hypothetical protein
MAMEEALAMAASKPFVPVELRAYVEAHLTEKAQRVFPNATCYKLKDGQSVRFVMQRGDGQGEDALGPRSVVLGFKFRDAVEALNGLCRAGKAVC